MDPEFQRVLFRTLLLGVPILAIGATLLVIAFRAFAPAESRGRDFRPALLSGGLLFFVFIACVLLLRLSMAVK